MTDDDATMNDDDLTTETLLAASIGLLAEGVAVTLFVGMALMWMMIYGTF